MVLQPQNVEEKQMSEQDSSQTDSAESQPLGNDTDTSTEKAIETSGDSGGKQFVSSSTKVADNLVPISETAEDSGDSSDAEVSDTDIDSIIDEVLGETSEEGSSEPLDTDSIETDDDFEGNKDGFRKGIDKLKHQKQEALERAIRAEERAKILEEQINSATPPSKDSEAISEAELTKALKGFMEEGDEQGVLDIINYKQKQLEEKLVNQYESKRKQEREIAQKKQVEWNNIQKEYQPEAYDNPILIEDDDFDIRKTKSGLYQRAEQIFVKKYANIDGGMTLAVKDAFNELLLDKLNPKKSKKKKQEMEGLKNRLTKEQRKRSVSGGASSVEDAPAKVKASKDDLADAIGERRKYTNDRIGMGV